MPNALESLGRMTADRDELAERYAQVLDVLEKLKKGQISLENIQLTPQGWQVTVPTPIAPPPNRPPGQLEISNHPDLAPPQTGPRPAEWNDVVAAREAVVKNAGGTPRPAELPGTPHGVPAPVWSGGPVPTPEQRQPPEGFSAGKDNAPLFAEDK